MGLLVEEENIEKILVVGYILLLAKE
jgi:hypothetical protein